MEFRYKGIFNRLTQVTPERPIPIWVWIVLGLMVLKTLQIWSWALGEKFE